MTVVELDHPARYSESIIEAFRKLLSPGEYVHDPFAGTGERMGALADELDLEFTGCEIEAEFIVDERVHCGDSREPNNYPLHFIEIQTLADSEPDVIRLPFTIVTSPVYPNGIADNFRPTGICSKCKGTGGLLCEDDWCDECRCKPCGGTGARKIDRKTYRVAKMKATGDNHAELAEGNMGRHSYRSGKKARARYWALAGEVIRQWKPAGANRALVNVSDFVMGDSIVAHVEEWQTVLEACGWNVVAVHEVETPRYRNGANADKRAEREAILEATPQ